eukprot:gnl/Dysnectes_brevis/8685_a15621_312.p1 GENE.gnl/Dysnectes_brevis/8685_a15621_312~~gnl/Dysnectes_brevis/8685_a15621_312.p1  ORF type:complete len:123 (-),score=17.26 gnl/Dysnectes_brevis/8685_a15621_312:97-465(-)
MQAESKSSHLSPRPLSKLLPSTRYPVRLTWPYGGTSLLVAGSFNDWHPEPMIFDGEKWFIDLRLATGTYQYKFVKNGAEWAYDVTLPVMHDSTGNINNLLTVEPFSPTRTSRTSIAAGLGYM